jgi:hypothetical protein
MPETAAATRIEVTYEDGTVSTFTRDSAAVPRGEWVLNHGGLPLAVTGYDPPNVLRVLSNALGTKEIAE